MFITIQIIVHQPGVVAFTVILRIKKLRQEDGDFQSSLHRKILSQNTTKNPNYTPHQ